MIFNIFGLSKSKATSISKITTKSVSKGLHSVIFMQHTLLKYGL